MENLTPGQLFIIGFGILLAVAGAVNTMGSAAEKVVKLWKAAQAPNEAQDQRIQALEAWKEKVDVKLQNDHESNRVTQRALLALLDHGIDGNNIEQMQHAKEELQNHLINR